jgi:hypothetical protein
MDLVYRLNVGFSLQGSVLFVEKHNIPIWAPSEPPFNTFALQCCLLQFLWLLLKMDNFTWCIHMSQQVNLLSSTNKVEMHSRVIKIYWLFS